MLLQITLNITAEDLLQLLWQNQIYIKSINKTSAKSHVEGGFRLKIENEKIEAESTEYELIRKINLGKSA